LFIPFHNNVVSSILCHISPFVKRFPQTEPTTPPNGRLHPRRDCVESPFDRKLPESAFPLRQQATKRRRVQAMLGALTKYKT